MPPLKKGNKMIEKTLSIKVLGVILAENLSWRDHIKTLENKLAKSVGLLYRAKQFLDETILNIMYFSYIHSYLNYANIAWVRSSCTILKDISNKQKQTTRIVLDEIGFATQDLYYGILKPWMFINSIFFNT